MMILLVYTILPFSMAAKNRDNDHPSSSPPPPLPPSSSSPPPVNFHHLPGLHERTYSQLGDINIGAIMMVTGKSDTNPAEACSRDVTKTSYTLEITEAVAFAVAMVNRDPDLLPNTTLGFVIQGACVSSGVTIGTSLSFLPRSEHRNLCGGGGGNNGTANSCTPTTTTTTIATNTTTNTNPSTTTRPVESFESSRQWRSHDVVGVLAPTRSSLTVPVSSLYAVAGLPIIGYVVTSDELSNKVDHPYFFRIIPPDVYQVQAILKFIHANGWSYISVIYRDGSYGQKAFDNLQQHADTHGICIATSHRLTSSTDYAAVVDDLLDNSRSRAVVLFVFSSIFRKVLQAVVDKNATGHFVWIGADGVITYSGYEYQGASTDPAVGTFTFDLYTSYVPSFYEYIRRLRVSTSGNPWVKEVWDNLLGCSYDNGTCDPTADLLKSNSYRAYKGTALRIDAVLTFAHAIHNLLADRCPDARGARARDCVTGPLLRDYLRRVDFEGYCGRVRFDENQDVKGKYVIGQLVYDYYNYPFQDSDVTNVTRTKKILNKKIGMYDISTNEITYFQDSALSWDHLDVLERIVPLTNEFELNKEEGGGGSSTSNSAGATSTTTTPTTKIVVDAAVPESVCSRACLVGEYKIEKDLPCCWECRTCRDNERLVDGNTSCEACPSLMWPDASSAFTTCADIPPTFPKIADTVPIVLTSCATFALVVTVIVAFCYVINRDKRVIKASSHELSLLQLAAIFIGYGTVILFQTTPTHVTCSAIFFLFCVSFTLIYCPLVVKTVRIVRIFRSGKKNAQQLRFISSNSQLWFTGSLIAIQVALCAATHVLYSPGARRSQPIWSEKLVELSCDLTLPGLTSFLGYNIVLVSLCSVLAFMVRKLPDNFNESKFISMCVSTTLLIWLAFIPTYFTAHRQSVRAFLLSVALLFNHSVALIFLFVPKVYAAIFLSEESGGTGVSTSNSRFQ